MANAHILREIERALQEHQGDPHDPHFQSAISWLVATLTCRFTVLHCFEFDVASSGFPLELAASGFSAAYDDDHGNQIHHRCRSFLNGRLLQRREQEPLMPGEIREVAALVYSGTPHANAIGNLNVMLSFGPLAESYNPNSNVENSSTFGLNVLPIILMGTEASREDNTFAMWGNVATIMSTVRTRIATANEIKVEERHGLHLNTLAEYCAGARHDISLFPMQSVFELRFDTLQRYRAKCAVNLKRAVETGLKAQGGTKEDTSILGSISLDAALSISEICSVGGVLDLYATDTFVGTTPVFLASPTHVCFYISVCVLIAANPSLVDRDPRWANASSLRIRDSFLNLTPLYVSENATRKKHAEISALELVILHAMEKLKESSATGTLTLEQKSSIEHMTRQGIATCQELVGNAPPSTNYYRSASRDARQRALLNIMVDENTWLRTGVWRHRLFTTRDPTDDTEGGVHPKCVDIACTHLLRMLSCGAYSIVGDCAASIPGFCCNSRKWPCSKCDNEILSNELLCRTHLTMGCSRCHALFCKGCCEHARMLSAEEFAPTNGVFQISEGVRQEMGDVWRCRRCVSEQRRAIDEAEKKKTAQTKREEKKKKKKG